MADLSPKTFEELIGGSDLPPPASFDDLIGANPAPSRLPARQKITPDLLEQSDLIKGDFAKTLAPAIPETTQAHDPESFEELISSGDSRGVLLADPKEISSLAARKKDYSPASFEELIAQEPSKNPVMKYLEDNRVGDRIMEAFESKTAKTIFTTLSIDEHLIVKGLSEIAGDPDKEDISEYTWTNFLKTRGAPDDGLTQALGLGMSIVLSPSTYLTFGAGPAQKLVSKGGVAAEKFLTKQGRRLVDKAVAEEVAAKLSKRSTKLGRPLEQKEITSIAQKTKQDVETAIIKRFSDMDKSVHGIKSGKAAKEVAAGLPDNIISSGGARLEIPFLGEVPIIPADKVIKASSRLATFSKAVLELEGFQKTVQATGAGAALEEAKKIRDFLGEKFIHKYKVDKQMVKAFQDATTDNKYEKVSEIFRQGGKTEEQISIAKIVATYNETSLKAEDLKDQAFKFADNFFADLSKKEKQEFGEYMIQASTKTEKITSVDDIANPKVKNKAEEWLGIGKHAGKKTLKDELADKLDLIDDNRLKNWFPGIDERVTKETLKFSDRLSPSEREFLKSRKANPDIYTRNPVDALGVRLTEISYAELQDDFYKTIASGKLGDVKQFKTIGDAIDAGYAPIRRPPMAAIAKGDDIADRVKESTVYVKKEIAEQYNNLIFSQGNKNLLMKYANMYTGGWKRAVTRLFPSFHARNFNSNIVLNAMKIGGHAINPVNNKMAIDMVTGRNLGKTVRSNIGEAFTLGSLKKEAENLGVFRSGFLKHDLGGETLSPRSQNAWMNIANRYFNPFSSEFMPLQKMDRFGEAIESQARMVNYLHWRKRGLSPAAAAREVHDALFDYSAITNFEKTLNNTVLPFYTFTRKNIETHLKTLAFKPGVVGAQMKFFRDVGPSEDDLREQFPDWAKKKFGLSVQGNFFHGFGIPIEDLFETMSDPERQAVLRLNPLIRVPLEKTFQKDFFSNRAIEQVNNANEFKSIIQITENKDIPEFVRAPFVEMRKFLKLQRDPSNKNKIIGDPDLLHSMRLLWSTRWQSVMGQLSKEDQSTAAKIIRFTTGWVALDPDPKLKRSIERAKTIKEIQKIAQQNNLAKPLGTFFVGGDEFSRSVANWYLKMAEEGGSVEKMRRIKGAFKEKAEAIEEKKVSR